MSSPKHVRLRREMADEIPRSRREREGSFHARPVFARTHNTHDKLGECVATREGEEKCGMSECREHDDDDDTEDGVESTITIRQTARDGKN